MLSNLISSSAVYIRRAYDKAITQEKRLPPLYLHGHSSLPLFENILPFILNWFPSNLMVLQVLRTHPGHIFVFSLCKHMTLGTVPIHSS